MVALSNAEMDALNGTAALFEAHATSESRTTAELQTARVIRVESHPKDKGVYIPPSFSRWVRAMGGDSTKIQVLSQCVYWFVKSDSGKAKISKQAKNSTDYSLVKTYGELGIESGVTEKMAKDSIRWARDVGILLKEPHGFAGKKAMYIRFACAEGRDYITDHQQVMDYPYPIRTHTSDPFGPTGTFHSDPQVFSNTESTFAESTYTKQNIKNASSKSIEATAAHPESLQAISGETSQKQTPIPETPPDQPQPGQFDEKYLNGLYEQAKAVWEKLETDYTVAHGKPCLVPGWPKAKVQPLERFVFEMVKLNHDPIAMLAWLTPAKWQAVGFSNPADASDCILNPLFLKSHADLFINAYTAPLIAGIKAKSHGALKQYKGGIKSIHHKVQLAMKNGVKGKSADSVPPVLIQAAATATSAVTATMITGPAKPQVAAPTVPSVSSVHAWMKQQEDKAKAAKAQAAAEKAKAVAVYKLMHAHG